MPTFQYLSFQGIQRLYEEGDDPEELDEGVGEDTMEEEQDEEDEDEEEKEKDGEHDGMQSKSHLLPERRSRRLKSEVSHASYIYCRSLAKDTFLCILFLCTLLFHCRI